MATRRIRRMSCSANTISPFAGADSTRRLEIQFNGSGATYLIDGCSKTTIRILLPVEMTSFDAVSSGDKLHLNWATATETNNAGFEVQTRYRGDDGHSAWAVVDFVPGAGTTAEPRQYSFEVSGLKPGPHAFRLKQIDFDGAFELSGEVEVAVEMPEAFLVHAVYPNPLQGRATMELAVQHSERVSLELFTLLGQRVSTLFDGMLEAGSLKLIDMDLSDQPVGTYVIKIEGERFNTAQLVSIVR